MPRSQYGLHKWEKSTKNMYVNDGQPGEVESILLDRILLLGREIEQLTEKFFSSLSLSEDNKTGLLMLSMSIRSLNFFRAILQLSPEQLTQPIAACLRCLIEQRWVFESIANCETRDVAIQRLIEHEEYNRKRGIGNLRALGRDGRDSRITDESLAKVEAGIVSPSARHDLGRWANLANRSHEYLTAYTLLCDQTHPSLRAVDSHVLLGADGRICSVSAKAESELLLLHLVFACDIVIDFIEAFSIAMKADEVTDQFASLRSRVSEYWKLVPDPLGQ